MLGAVLVAAVALLVQSIESGKSIAMCKSTQLLAQFALCTLSVCALKEIASKSVEVVVFAAREHGIAHRRMHRQCRVLQSAYLYGCGVHYVLSILFSIDHTTAV